MYANNHPAIAAIADELATLDIPVEQQAAILADVQQKFVAARRATRTARDPIKVELARKVHRTRLKGNQLIGGRIMSDPKFEMLLSLFVADHDGRRLSVTDLCLSASAPVTTGLRHVERLEADGFIRRDPDRKDGRRFWVEPTERALSGVDAYMTELARDR